MLLSITSCEFICKWLNERHWYVYSQIRLIGVRNCPIKVMIHSWLIWVLHPTTFSTSFDATATALRRIYAARTFAAAGSIGSFCLVVILHVVIVNLVDCENCENEIDMGDVSDEVEDRNLMSLTIDEKRSEIISFVLRTFKHYRNTLKFNHHE